MKINPVPGVSLGTVALSGAMEPSKEGGGGVLPLRSIKMNTNRTVNRYGEPTENVPRGTNEVAEPEKKEEPVVQKTLEALAPKPESGIPDASVQANAETEATAPLSPQLAAIARQRRALQVKEKELAEREKALTGNSRDELVTRIKASPLSVLLEHGVTYDQLTDEILERQKSQNPELDALKAEVKALKGEVDQKFVSSIEEQEMAVLNSIADEIEDVIKDSDEFETVRTVGAQEQVLRHIYDTYKRTGKVLDTDAALKFVEQTERVKRKAELAKLKWVKSEFLPQPTPEPQEQKQGMRTLTNKDQARPTMSRRQRAINAALGQK